MREIKILLQTCFLVLALTFLVKGSTLISYNPKAASFANRIEGQVYDLNRRPVAEANVELLDDVGSLLSHSKTDYSGRFSFVGVSAGRFKIKVLPFKTALMEQMKDVEVVPPSVRRNVSSSDIVYVEFYLQPLKRHSDILDEVSPEVVFAQNIPQNAEKLFKEGINMLEKNSDEGLIKLEEAIKIFPEYYDALSRLGKEYVLKKDYKKAYPYLLKAIDINPKSFSTYYNLGFTFYQLNEMPAALLAMKTCVFLNPNSVSAQLLYGTLLRMNKNYEDAEKYLVKADSLAKGKNAEANWQLALLYNRLNKNKEAISKLETYLKLVPDSPDKTNIKELIAKLKAADNKN